MRRPNPPALIVALVVALAGPASVSARYAEPVTIEGVRFPPLRSAADQPLQLTGYGVATARVFFDVYAAALYLPDGTKAGAVLSPRTPRRLEIEYLMALEADDLIKAADTILQRQHDAETLAGVREQVEALHALYEDVGPGDRYAMTYVPGEGTTLSLNGSVLGRVPGAQFARVYFGIWLGDQPLSEALREKLLATLNRGS